MTKEKFISEIKKIENKKCFYFLTIERFENLFTNNKPKIRIKFSQKCGGETILVEDTYEEVLMKFKKTIKWKY